MIKSSKTTSTEAALYYGMVGGGKNSFIGDVHRKAIGFDAKAEIVAACFSRDFEDTIATGTALSIEEECLYRSYEEMAETEGSRDDKVDFIVIVTPNNTHFAIAKAFLERGIHVVCDKPLTIAVEEAEELGRIVAEKKLLFCVTYTYTGYPMVKQAREMIRRGEIGEIRFIHAEYPQDWLATPLEKTDHKQAAWRTDPAQAGRSNCVGDIGSHVANMVSYLTGLPITSLCARLDTFVKGRKLDDNATIMVNYANGARGVYWMSQIAIGHDNGLKVRIYGTQGSIEWAQEHPNELLVSSLDKPKQILIRGRDQLYPRAAAVSRIPAGHPEGYFEAFANIYAIFADALLKRKTGIPLTEDDCDFPTVQDGIDGVRFIHKSVESSEKGSLWVKM